MLVCLPTPGNIVTETEFASGKIQKHFFVSRPYILFRKHSFFVSPPQKQCCVVALDVAVYTALYTQIYTTCELNVFNKMFPRVGDCVKRGM